MICNDAKDLFFDYLDGTLDSITQTLLEAHFAKCPDCQAEMAELEKIDVALKKEAETIVMPKNFMSNVRNKVNMTHRKKKKILKLNSLLAGAAALFLTFFVGTAVANGGFATLTDWWKNLSQNEDEQMKGIIEEGLGEELNLTEEQNGVKIKIKSVAADDIQTLIYYEVENAASSKKFQIKYSDGITFGDMERHWRDEDGTMESPVRSQLNLYSNQEGVYKGKLALAPLKNDQGTLDITVGQLEEVVTDPSTFSEVGEEAHEPEQIEGSWSFKIPVKKYPAIEHKLNVKAEVDGNPIVFEKLTIAPTATLLKYRYRDNQSAKTLENILIDSIEANGKLAKSDLFGGITYSGSEGAGWVTEQASFGSLYLENPTAVKINIGSLHYAIEDEKKISLGENMQLPLTFTYQNNNITIEKMEIGAQTKIVMTEELPADRTYEMLRYDFLGNNGNVSAGAQIDGYFIDKHGTKYKVSDYMLRTDELKEPKFFSTQHRIELTESEKNQSFIPEALQIEGYTQTQYINKKIKIKLK
ncbi:DUF4179 domain-containing protein [Neobacillus notoginsengisoli]|uniref:Anti-sigma-W factor RsiW n=1 Tax=Neobacillus notoginsengisoli TaxID=1578198 RepID=A0A417YT36_9BACI|nr:DUF4179 domain-containing protein [Neobacillus notoginsengisoli]RHW39139.1 DUF4179 domain-containing protein [Neobacillus notoginsengisoli]